MRGRLKPAPPYKGRSAYGGVVPQELFFTETVPRSVPAVISATVPIGAMLILAGLVAKPAAKA